MTTSKNPNGYIPIVFTYGGKDLTYSEFLDQFSLTLPAGNGVYLGQDQYFGYGSNNQETLQTGQNYPLNKATSAANLLVATNAVKSKKIQDALKHWASEQAASPGEDAYANVYLDYYTGGRIYLSNANLHIQNGGEPDPSDTTSASYSCVYDFFEPYIAAAIHTTQVPGNNADITDIDWFSFPISLKVWSYDFSADNGVLSETNVKKGGDGNAIYNALFTPKTDTHASNAYPSQQFPDTDKNSNSVNNLASSRLTGPTMAAAPSSYYTDPAENPFPYHDFTDYLLYLSTNAPTLTLAGSFAGLGSKATETPDLAQEFSFTVDFSQIKAVQNTYPSGTYKQISKDSAITFTGYTYADDEKKTAILGTEKKQFTITVPWYKASTNVSLQTVNTFTNATDAVSKGWLTVSSGNTGESGIYGPVGAETLNSSGQVINSTTGQNTELHLIYSLNSNPISGTLDNLYNNKTVTVKSDGTLTCLANHRHVAPLPANPATQLIITTDGNGDISSATINDYQQSPHVGLGTSWTIPKGNTDLGNNIAFTVEVVEAPQLRNIFIQATGVWSTEPASLSIAKTSNKFNAFTATINDSAFTGSGQDFSWTTLSMPGGIYGANAGYSVSELTGDNAQYNTDTPALINNLFGWVVADLLAALNAGLVGSPAPWPEGSKTGTIGNSPQDWFNSAGNPYTQGKWGEAAWKGVKVDKVPVNNFWNTWAWALYNVPDVDAYNFAFTDRFESGILLNYNPPPASPTGTHPVLLEVIVEDSPFIGIQANQPWFDTGIHIAQGDSVTISAVSGTWTADPDTNHGKQYDAAGCPDVLTTQAGYPLQQVAMGALIGKIGNDGNPFLVANGPKQTPTGESGNLFLCINDDLSGLYGAGLNDNAGSIKVLITKNPTT